MQLKLDVGLASVYLVTDPTRGIGIIHNPYLLLARRTLGLADFANFINRSKANAQIHLPDIDQLLREVINDKNLSNAIPLPTPLLVIADDLAPELLSALKRLKLRGLISSLAVRGGIRTSELEEPVTQLFQTFQESLMYAEAGQLLLAFRAISGLWVVSGLRQTILSTTMAESEIVRAYPGLIADISNVHEPL